VHAHAHARVSEAGPVIPSRRRRTAAYRSRSRLHRWRCPAMMPASSAALSFLARSPASPHQGPAHGQMRCPAPITKVTRKQHGGATTNRAAENLSPLPSFHRSHDTSKGEPVTHRPLRLKLGELLPRLVRLPSIEERHSVVEVYEVVRLQRNGLHNHRRKQPAQHDSCGAAEWPRLLDCSGV